MRRILWSLAASSAFGATVSWTVAQEAPAFPQEPASYSSFSSSPGRVTTGGSLGTERRTYSDLFGSEDSRPFPGGQQTLPRAGSLSEARASDLFRREVSPATARNAGLTGQQLEDQFQRVSAEQVDPNSNVVQAGFERAPDQREPIEQVRGPGVARDFPRTAATSQPAATAARPVNRRSKKSSRPRRLRRLLRRSLRSARAARRGSPSRGWCSQSRPHQRVAASRWSALNSPRCRRRAASRSRGRHLRRVRCRRRSSGRCRRRKLSRCRLDLPRSCRRRCRV